MAKQRIIFDELINDEKFNSLSIEAQNLFLRMLVVSDDCGVVPASIFTLTNLINPPVGMREKIAELIDEILKAKLGSSWYSNGNPFFIFKSHSFDHHQSSLLTERKRSEYLKMSYFDFELRNFKDPLDSLGYLEYLRDQEIVREQACLKKHECMIMREIFEGPLHPSKS